MGALRVLASVLALSGAAAAAPVAMAQTPNPLSPFPQTQAPVPTTSTPTVLTSVPTTSSGDSSFSGTSAVAIAIGAIVILGGISLFIWRDARRRAPVRHRAATATAGSGGRAGPKQRVKPRKLSPAERRRRKRGRAR